MSVSSQYLSGLQCYCLAKMKLIIFIVMAIIVQDLEGRYTLRHKRSIYVVDLISNKTTAVSNYMVKKARSIKDFTINTANNTVASVSNYVRHGIHSVKEFVDERRLSKKFKSYINMAQRTSKTVYEYIAPEKVEHECSDDNTTKYMTTPELISLHGYYAETHTIITEDGYLLTVHRIPYSKDRPENKNSDKTVLLHHGILGTSIDWIIPGLNNSLAYMLSDAGYDVWMANVRGNTYSRAHVSRTLESYAFWNFTFHEVGEYDLPAVIDYIITTKKGNAKINYIGFSMGTTALFTLLSTKPQYNYILYAGYALAPIVYMRDVQSPFKLLAKFGNNLEQFMKLVGANEFLPRNAVVRYLSKHACKITEFQDALCEMSMFLLCGYDKDHFDGSLMPLILGHVPAGTSSKTLAHYAQEIKNHGQFQQFDYGVEGNLKQYGQETAPEYPLHRVTLPITLFSAESDWLSSLEDATNLSIQLAKVREHYVVPDKTFNHLDFMFAKDAHSLVYDKLLMLLEKSYSDKTLESNFIP